MKKTKRHFKIIKLIKEEEIQTQDELSDRLREEGFDVTQATVSRDIKQLKLVKISTQGGEYRYSLPSTLRKNDNLTSRTERMFKDSLISIDYSENIIVIKTLSGLAQGIASLLDNIKLDKVIGTIAGDDTILMIIKPKSAVLDVIVRLESFL